ncbi:hypothetical protein EJB05_07729, partial [Eragrostis curvula]
MVSFLLGGVAVSLPGVPGAVPAPAPASGAPFFGQSPSSSTPSASPAGTTPSASPSGTGSDFTTGTPARAPSPSRSDQLLGANTSGEEKL